MRQLDAIHEKRLRWPRSATSIIQNLVFSRRKTLHGSVSAATWVGVGSGKLGSPVKESADDADGHQQLQHQDQVDLPDEACG